MAGRSAFELTTEERHLSSDEVEDLLRFIEQTKTIVVGGQALALWCRLFLDRDPKIAAYYSLSSDDLDVFGSAGEAKSLAQHLADAELLIPEAWDNSPNAAVVMGRLGNHRIRVDYMRAVLGVTDATLKNNYVTLTKETGRGPLSMHLMHPMDCLRSRLSNINDLHREGLHAISSAKAALAVTDLFIDQTIALGNSREAQAMLMNLVYIGRDRCIGKPAHTKFGLNTSDILSKYRIDIRLDNRFRSHQLANALKMLAKKIEIANRRNKPPDDSTPHDDAPAPQN